MKGDTKIKGAVSHCVPRQDGGYLIKLHGWSGAASSPRAIALGARVLIKNGNVELIR